MNEKKTNGILMPCCCDFWIQKKIQANKKVVR